ncbi:MAG: bactofilin family protein [Bryobacteraceae bacterium]
MWNKRNEEDPRARATVTPEPAAPVRTTNAPAAASQRTEASRPPAVLGKSMIVKGEIHSEEDLTIDGEVEGAIDVPEHRVTIGATGKVSVNLVRAREVVIVGSLKGSIDASDKVLIRKDAQLVGDVQTAGIVIEDGAYFKGGIDIRRPK